MIPGKIELANLFEGFSLVIDLAERKPLNHAKNVAYIASRFAEEVSLSSHEREVLYYASLLHNVNLMSPQKSCPVCEILREHNSHNLLPILSKADQAVHLSAETWNGRGSLGLLESSIPIVSRLLSIATVMEHSRLAATNFWKWKQQIKSSIRKKSGVIYDPFLVDVLDKLLSEHRFCLELFDLNYEKKLCPYRPDSYIYQEGDILNIIGKVFATFIDSKTTYTANHSKDVAMVSRLLAAALGFDSQMQKNLFLAGLLHDIGKIAIPNAILEKSSPLTKQEFEEIKNHSYYSALILDGIPELREIGKIVCLHHEKLDGSGYYLGLREEDIPLEARIVAVADIFSALVVDRPYRKSMEIKKAFALINKMVKQKQLDQRVCEALFSIN